MSFVKVLTDTSGHKVKHEAAKEKIESIRLEIKRKMADKYNTEDENPKRKCPHDLCQGDGAFRRVIKGYETVTDCLCKKERRLKQVVLKAEIPDRYLGYTLSPNNNVTLKRKPAQFELWGDRENRLRKDHALTAAKTALFEFKKWLKNPKEFKPKSLFIHGAPGTGKTLLACALIQDLIYFKLDDVLFLDFQNIMSDISAAISEGRNESNLLGPAKEAKFLLVDDANPADAANVVGYNNKLSVIIGHRYNNNLPTIITSNATAELSFFDRRLKSRIMEACDFIHVTGGDYRERFNQQQSLMGILTKAVS